MLIKTTAYLGGHWTPGQRQTIEATKIAMGFRAAILGRRADGTPVVQTMTTNSTTKEADAEIKDGTASILDDLGNVEEGQGDMTGDEVVLQVTNGEEHLAFQQAALHTTGHPTVNTDTSLTAPGTAQVEDLSIQPRGTRRAYTGEAPRKRWNDDDPDDIIEQGVEHRVLFLPNSSQDIEEQRQ